jgi:hypothetical protein
MGLEIENGASSAVTPVEVAAPEPPQEQVQAPPPPAAEETAAPSSPTAYAEKTGLDPAQQGAEMRQRLDDALPAPKGPPPADAPKPPPAAKEFPEVTKLKETKGFKALNEDEQKKLLAYVGGANKEISEPGRKALGTLLGDKATKADDPETFRKFLKDQPGAPGVVDAAPGTFDTRREKYKVSDKPTEVKDYAFRSGKADALKYDVEINGQKIAVYLPKTPDAKQGKFHSLEEVAKGLAALPESSRKLVKEVHVQPNQNPDDAYWAKQYNQPGFRSYMTAGADGVISAYPSTNKISQTYLDGTMIHETGHTLSNKKWGADNTAKGWDPWRAAMKSDGIIPSQYAKSSADEDFAETLQLYQTVKGTAAEKEIRALMPERFKIIDDLLK